MKLSHRTLLAGSAAALALLPVGSNSRAATSDCADSNPSNELVVAAGSPQTAQLGKRFQTNLQVQLANTNGCPVTGQLGGNTVEFVAPSSGASGTFASSGSNVTVVGTDAQGLATAPVFTANFTAGSYHVAVQSGYGAANLYLTNTASGLPASIAATGATSQEATVNGQYAQPLQARVTDANGKPVQGATVSFSIVTGVTGAGASFLGGGPATASTDSNGLASSPPLLANKTVGTFTATATSTDVSHPATYTLKNLAAAPETITAGAASGASTPVGRRFPVRLAVTVTDKNGNPVPETTVVFAAPARGPSGHFTIHPKNRNQSAKTKPAELRTNRIVRVTTNSNGIAIAPPFTANMKAGGYVVTATVKGSSKRAAFALINQPRP
jgi:protocatechuate 3,4-dioxygenase beta subunit